MYRNVLCDNKVIYIDIIIHPHLLLYSHYLFIGNGVCSTSHSLIILKV